MKCRLLLVLLAGFSCVLVNIADPLITFSFKPYALQPQAPEAFVLPEKITIRRLELLFSSIVAGIPVSYGGYLTVSDLQGVVSLPRLHEKPLISFLVTPRITPMVMGGLTIHHWEREEGTPAELYTAERTQNPKTKKFEWLVRQEVLPKSMIIKPSTIIIFAEPHLVILPTGTFPTSNQPNLVLPDIYVKDDILVNQRSLYLMNIKQFFGPMLPLYKKNPALYQKHLTYEKHS
jgi:hypothetical protein